MDSLALLARLERLRPHDLLDRVALAAQMPASLRPSPHLVHAARCLAVLEWANGSNGCGLEALQAALDQALQPLQEEVAAAGPSSGEKLNAPDDRLARQLLFGVLAVQMELIDAQQFTDACAGWTTNKHSTLAELLESRGWITPDDRQDVERFVERKLKKHGGDAPATLRASVDDATREAIRQSQVPEIRNSLSDSPEPQHGSSNGDAETDPFNQPSGESRYRWMSLYRQGGLGQVWLARDAHFQRDVAVKTLRADRQGHPAARQRLHHEAQITGRLEHPNIVPVYELGRRGDDGKPFYAMRFLRGQTLADRIADHHRQKVEGRLDPVQRRRLLGVFLDVCDAVAYAHAQGVIHLDIKPENVLLGDFGEVSLLDWGLARPMSPADAEATLAPENEDTLSDAELLGAEPTPAAKRRPLGTPAYMAPEQAEHGLNRLGPQTDVYGLGATLFELLTGRAPHEGESLEAVVQKIIDGPPPLAREVEPAAPPPLERICARAMAKIPADRYPTVQELAAAVRHWLDEEPLETYRSEIAHFRTQCDAHPEKREYREHLARNHVNLALVLGGMSRHDEAEQSLQQAIDLYRALIEEFPAVARRLRADLAATLIHRRNALLSLGRIADAEVMYRDALNEYERLMRANPKDEYYRSLYASLFLSARGETPSDSKSFSANDLLGAESDGEDADGKPPGEILEPPRFRLHTLAGAEANWLFTAFALRLRRVEPSAVAGAMNAWLDDQAVDVGAYLRRHAELAAADHDLLRSLVATHQEQHRTPTPHMPPSSQRQDAPLSHIIEPSRPQETTVGLPEFSSEAANPLRTITGDRFQLQSKLGEGGLSAVFVAHDNALEREVAIKSLHERLLDQPEARAMLLREAKVTANLEHAGIIPIYDLGSYADGAPFFAMRRIKGVSLHDEAETLHRARKADPHSEEFLRELRRLVGLLIQVCRTVEYAHRRGVVHRDLKPQNIMITAHGETFVIDWGLAILADRKDLHEPEGHIVGTPAFMSPEQARGEIRAIDRHSDIYTLGATLFFLLTGERPFEGSIKSTLWQVTKVDIPPARVKNPLVPAPLEAICAKAMARRPEDRYASAAAFAEDLERWRAGEPVSVCREPWRQRLARQLHCPSGATLGVALLAASLVGMLLAVLVLAWAF